MSFVDRGDDPSDQKLRTFMCLLFTESSFAFRFLLVLNDRIKSHLTVLESAQYRDKRFATKFRFALDTRYFRWMEQCKGSKDRESVNNQLLKFDTLLDSVLTEQFHQTIPSTMRLVDDVHLTVLESAQYRDKRFATKFRFALDTRYFRWMEQCKGSKDRESVNNQLLKFDTLLDSVLTEQFHQTIPSTMRLVDDVKIPSSTGSGSLKDPDTKIVCPRSIVLYCLRHSTIARSS